MKIASQNEVCSICRVEWRKDCKCQNRWINQRCGGQLIPQMDNFFVSPLFVSPVWHQKHEEALPAGPARRRFHNNPFRLQVLAANLKLWNDAFRAEMGNLWLRWCKCSFYTCLAQCLWSRWTITSCLLWNTRTDGRVGSFEPILHVALRPEYMWRLVRLPDIWLCSVAL